MTKKILLLIISITVPFLMNGQCGPSNGVGNINFTANFTFGQSFTLSSSCSGTLTSVEVNGLILSQPITNVDVILYLGNGDMSVLIGIINGITLNANNIFDFSTQDLTMFSDEIYTIWIVTNGASGSIGQLVDDSVTNPNSGSLWTDGDEYTGLFSQFSVIVDNSTLSTISQEFKETDISVYPVPAINSINISGLKTTSQYVIYNVLGKVVKRGNVSKNESLDISDFKQGVYFLRLNGTKTIKCVKK